MLGPYATRDATPEPSQDDVVKRRIDVLFLVPVRATVYVQHGTPEQAQQFALEAVKRGDVAVSIDWDAKSAPAVVSSKLDSGKGVSETVSQQLTPLRIFQELVSRF